MASDPESETYPIVKFSWVPGANAEVPHLTESADAEKNADSFSQQTAQPAKTPNIGIYTASGTLDGQSRLAQTLREAKDMKGKSIRPGGD